jgi:hypothetical protein
MSTDQYAELGRIFADALAQGLRIAGSTVPAPSVPRAPEQAPEHVFDDENLQRILDCQQFIDTIPRRFRQQMVDTHITRLVKRESGDPSFQTIADEAPEYDY